MRRVAGSTRIVGNNKLLMAAELPRDRNGRYKDSTKNGNAVNVVNYVIPQTAPGLGTVTVPPQIRMVSEAKRIDVISRIIFPLSFAGFNVMYWSYYLTMSYYSTFRK